MSKGFIRLLAVLAVALTAVTAHGLAKRAGAEWLYYYFDGRAFVAGQPPEGVPFVAVRDGVRPVVSPRMPQVKAVPLPRGTGALAGICYVQSSGGKLRDGRGYLPLSAEVVELRKDGRVVATTQSDEDGYFVLELPAGKYTVYLKGAVETTVGNGTTTLLPIRGGKRMVD